MKVAVLRITTKYGTDVSAHSTHDSAHAALAAYVREHWDEDGPGTDGVQAPADDGEAIYAYYEERQYTDEYDIDVLEAAPTFVHTVEVLDRLDGAYVFADVDDAIRFEKVVNDNAGDEMACVRREQLVCTAEDTNKLIEAEREEWA